MEKYLTSELGIFHIEIESLIHHIQGNFNSRPGFILINDISNLISFQRKDFTYPMNTFFQKCDFLTYRVFTLVGRYFAIILPAYFLSFILGYFLIVWEVTWAFIPWSILIFIISFFYLACVAYYYIRQKRS